MRDWTAQAWIRPAFSSLAIALILIRCGPISLGVSAQADSDVRAYGSAHDDARQNLASLNHAEPDRSKALARASNQQDTLLGLWDCYRQDDRAPVVSCLHAIEFLPGGKMIERSFSDSEHESEWRYAVHAKRIKATEITTGTVQRFTFRILENGDLLLRKAPWNWTGWLTRDPARMRKDHGCSLAPKGP